jgi:hypothetical protein
MTKTPPPVIEGSGPSIMTEQTNFLGGPSNMVHVFPRVLTQKFFLKPGEIY